jgi:hypothetical protein
MKKASFSLMIITIALNLLIGVLVSLILYKTIWHVEIKPGFFITEKIRFINETIDINELKDYMRSELATRAILNKEKNEYINSVLLYSCLTIIITFFSLLCCFILMFRLKRKI